MGKGRNKQQAPTDQTITQTNIPKEFMPYFDRLLARTEEQSMQPYQGYGGSRLAAADQFADIGASQGMVRDISGRGIAGLDLAQANAAANIARANELGQYDTGNFTQYGGFQAGKATPYAGFTQAGFNEFGFGPSGKFTGSAVSEYMDPYMQNVVDIEKRRAMEDYGIARSGRTTRAVQAGAFGGSRGAVQEGLAERDLLERQGGIQARGLSTAYGDAQRMFEADRAARMSTEQAQAAEAGRVQAGTASEMGRVQGGQAAELGRTQGINIGEAARVQAAQAAELGRVQTGIEASRQFGAGQGLAALGASEAAGRQLVGLGEKEREAAIQNAQLLDSIGRSQQAETQASLDIGYQDFLRQQGYPAEQTALMSNVLQGLPIQNAGTTTATGYTYTNPMQQAAGAGLTGLALYKAYQ